jgi:hypothetical protein
MEEPRAGGYGINVGLWCGGRDSMWSFHFQVSPSDEKLPDPLDEVSPLL